jgi:hypothetical protein
MTKQKIVLNDAFALLLPACGEKVGMRGRCRWAQNNGHAPAPARFARVLSRMRER